MPIGIFVFLFEQNNEGIDYCSERDNKEVKKNKKNAAKNCIT